MPGFRLSPSTDFTLSTLDRRVGTSPEIGRVLGTALILAERGDMTVSNWYESFFDEVAMDFWRQACPPETTRQEVDLVEDLFSLSPRARILDIPCGLGRHSLELAGRGYQVSAVDSSVWAIQEFEKEAGRFRELIEISQNDMREISWQNRFDGAICLGNSFGYLDRTGTRDFVVAVGQSLRKGGHFLIETGLVAESILPNLDERNWLQTGEYLVLLEHNYRVDLSRLDTVYTFKKHGQTHEKYASHYIFTVAEITCFLQDAGLSVQSLFSSISREPFQVASESLLIHAIRGQSP